MAKSPAWQRKEGKNPEGGLNAKGRASYNAANPGKPGLKAPQPEGGPRRDSFCARMEGMKKKLTGEKAKKDPLSIFSAKKFTQPQTVKVVVRRTRVGCIEIAIEGALSERAAAEEALRRADTASFSEHSEECNVQTVSLG